MNLLRQYEPHGQTKCLLFTNLAAASEGGCRLEISDLGNRGNLLCSEYKGADKLCSYCADDLRLCFHICKNQVFSQWALMKTAHLVSAVGSAVTEQLISTIVLRIYKNQVFSRHGT